MDNNIEKTFFDEVNLVQEEKLENSNSILKYEKILKKSNGFLSSLTESDINIEFLSSEDFKKLESEDCPLELLVYATLEAVSNNDINIEKLQKIMIENNMGEEYD